MDLQTAQDTWRRFLAGAELPSAEGFCAAIGNSFLAEARRNPTAALPFIELLCAMATQPEQAVAEAANSTLFTTIIERLCDDFSQRQVDLANLVLITILGWLRHTPEGQHLDQLLVARGFLDSEDILAHYRKLRQPPFLDRDRREKVRKILILSRVTAGADIAITSIIIDRLHQAIPQAQLLLIGPRHLRDLFGSLGYIVWLPFEYKNRGNLFEKMTSWPVLWAMAQEAQKGLGPGEVIVVDPDSRLSQLGLLPLLDEEHTYYFNSRAMGESSNASLSALTNQWLNQFLGEAPYHYPRLKIADPDQRCQRFCDRLRENGCRFLLVINWGVGNNLAKRIPDPFEERLLLALLEEPDTIVLLDSGTGQRCEVQVKHLLAAASEKELPTVFLTEQELQPEAISFAHGVIGFEGSLVTLGGFIGHADLFIGYDSCPQHLAAAVDTESLILFAGAPSPRFMARWRPDNPRVRAIPIQPRSGQSEEGQRALLAEVGRQVAELRKKPRKVDATFH